MSLTMTSLVVPKTIRQPIHIQPTTPTPPSPPGSTSSDTQPTATTTRATKSEDTNTSSYKKRSSSSSSSRASEELFNAAFDALGKATSMDAILDNTNTKNTNTEEKREIIRLYREGCDLLEMAAVHHLQEHSAEHTLVMDKRDMYRRRARELSNALLPLANPIPRGPGDDGDDEEAAAAPPPVADVTVDHNQNFHQFAQSLRSLRGGGSDDVEDQLSSLTPSSLPTVKNHNNNDNNDMPSAPPAETEAEEDSESVAAASAAPSAPPMPPTAPPPPPPALPVVMDLPSNDSINHRELTEKEKEEEFPNKNIKEQEDNHPPNQHNNNNEEEEDDDDNLLSKEEKMKKANDLLNRAMRMDDGHTITQIEENEKKKESLIQIYQRTANLYSMIIHEITLTKETKKKNRTLIKELKGKLDMVQARLKDLKKSSNTTNTTNETKKGKKKSWLCGACA